LIRVARFNYSQDEYYYAHQAGIFALATICQTGVHRLGYSATSQPLIAGRFVSIAHSAGCAVAATSEYPIGVDIEPISRVIDDSLAGYLIADPERTIFKHSSDIIKAWVIKESVLKMRGSGVTGPPRSLVRILSKEGAIYICKDLVGIIRVKVYRRQGYIIAIAHERANEEITIH